MLNDKGKVKVKLKKPLPAGKTKLKVHQYPGDDYTAKSKDKKVVVRVALTSLTS